MKWQVQCHRLLVRTKPDSTCERTVHPQVDGLSVAVGGENSNSTCLFVKEKGKDG